MTVLDLQQYLLKHSACAVEVLNIGGGRTGIDGQCIGVKNGFDFLLKVMRFARRGYLIHLETNGHNPKSWLSALICAVAGYLNGRKTIIAFGSGNLPSYLLQLNQWRKVVVKAVLALAGVVICRNQNMVEAIQTVRERQDRIEIVPGFMGLHTRKLIDVPQDVREFCEAHTPLIGATVTLEPEYGASLALKAIQRLRLSHPRVGLILLGIGPEGGGAITRVRLREGACAPYRCCGCKCRLERDATPQSISAANVLRWGFSIRKGGTCLRNPCCG